MALAGWPMTPLRHVFDGYADPCIPHTNEPGVSCTLCLASHALQRRFQAATAGDAHELRRADYVARSACAKLQLEMGGRS